jgi:hypothetical protein
MVQTPTSGKGNQGRSRHRRRPSNFSKVGDGGGTLSAARKETLIVSVGTTLGYPRLHRKPQEASMRYEALLAALLILGQASPSSADHRIREPQFSGSDHQTIGRNELLNAIWEQDPWLVRRILDVMAQRHSPSEADPFAELPEGIDAVTNPDIANGTRAAAGSVEWMELLKRAHAEKEGKGGLSDRSAASSVEFIEMLRKIQQMKREPK